jgi:hypothetical protein
MDYLNKAIELKDARNRLKIEGHIVKNLKPSEEQLSCLRKLLPEDKQDSVVNQTLELLELKMAFGDSDLQRNSSSKNKYTLKKSMDHLIKALEYLNRLDPQTNEQLSIDVGLFYKNNSSSPDSRPLKIDPYDEITLQIGGLERALTSQSEYSRVDSVRFVVAELIKIFKKHGIKVGYFRNYRRVAKKSGVKFSFLKNHTFFLKPPL